MAEGGAAEGELQALEPPELEIIPGSVDPVPAAGGFTDLEVGASIHVQQRFRLATDSAQAREYADAVIANVHADTDLKKSNAQHTYRLAEKTEVETADLEKRADDEAKTRAGQRLARRLLRVAGIILLVIAIGLLGYDTYLWVTDGRPHQTAAVLQILFLAGAGMVAGSAFVKNG